jgi:cytochrome b561
MSTHYHPIAKGLHWLMAVAILGMMVLGLVMHEMPLSPEKLQYYSWHKWTGVSLFLLTWLRLLWRMVRPAPALPDTMPALHQRLAHLGHAALYGLMIAIPLSGWLMSSAKGVQTVWFGVWPIPDLLSKDKALSDLLAQVHATLNGVLGALLLGHAGAALKHHCIDRDDILLRMLPQFRQPSSRS